MSQEVLVPHELSRGPLTALRRMVVHSSIAEIKEIGAFSAYSALIEPHLFAEITDSLGPGWLSVDLALAHYRACDGIGLRESAIDTLGRLSYEKIKGAVLFGRSAGVPTEGEPAPWSGVGAMARMGRRVYEGGSAQYTRLSKSELLIENVGNPLFSVRYYRLAHVGFLHAAFVDFGVQVADVKLSTYSRRDSSIKVTIRWS